ncbi:uncharacterized protein LOC112527870 [Cynara cardunculus var. scolymus]|uniref:uncharacterized protein LOC112527870 n=1 Tax=Cynara cardunculus var. scolymus TaxID=59895 RepID=UPI000D63159B|nr:uncharacterized protein LOC112527870 [Cynara cardunculus var. scolymus]
MESTPQSKLYSDVSPPVTVRHSSSCGGGSSVGGSGFGCIEHTVSKFDTLAGVAIRYGVEVADIKKMNGLTTDLQMFACKSLKIPLPGRHPPSPIMSNGYHTQGQTSPEMTRPNRRYSDSFNPIESLKLSSSPHRNISSSINSLRDYYGLKPNDWNGVDEGFEMTRTSTLPLGLHRKSKSEANGFSKTHAMDNVPVANGKGAGIDKSIEKLVRRRKSEVDLNNHTLEMLLKHDNNNTTTSSSRIVLSTSAGKGLALRQKTANRTTIESEAGSSNMFPVGSRDSSIVQAFNGVRKSSSAPSFQHSETHNNNSNNNNTSSPSSSLFWPISILNFTADLQALSTTTPIFDGLPRPVSGRKNKAARD